ncbi:hypothetical protein CCP3SC15_730018 [Gammaproteobacteria bacterium]
MGGHISVDKCDSPFILFVHTNEYAGNFERELTGYVSGIWDHQTHGGDEAAMFKAAHPDSSLTEAAHFVPDEDLAWQRPCCIADPKNSGYTSLAIFFERSLSLEELQLIWKRARQFPEYMNTKRPGSFPSLKILGIDFIEREITVTDTPICSIHEPDLIST